MKKAILYALTFIVVLDILHACIMGVGSLLKVSHGTLLMVLTIVFNLFILALFARLKWTPMSRNYILSRPWSVLFWVVLAVLGCVLPSMWLQEHLPELRNLADGELKTLVFTPGGYFALAIAAPFAEEVVFRGAVLRVLLHRFVTPGEAQHRSRQAWMAIAISALLFAVVHMNPAQIPYAFVMGLFFGWMYWRTGSIIPSVVAHVVNNSVSYIMLRLYSDDVHLTDIFGGEAAALKAVGCSLLILLPAIYQLHLHMKQA